MYYDRPTYRFNCWYFNIFYTHAYMSILNNNHGACMMPVTAQASIIGLSKLQQINQTYGDDPSMQIVISQAQNTMFEIINSQISATLQVVINIINKYYIYMTFFIIYRR